MSTRSFLFSLPFAVFAVLLLLLATRPGIGLSRDSVTYIQDAEFLTPSVNYPPGTSLSLAALKWTGFDVASRAKLINLLCLFTSVLLMGELIFVATRSIWWTMISTALVAFSPTILAVHSMAWSEPLFIVFTMISFLYMAQYLQWSRRYDLFLSGVAMGAAGLTRYAGVGGITAFIFAVVILPKNSWRRRLRDAFIFSLVAALPLGLYVLRNVAVCGRAFGNRFDGTGNLLLANGMGPKFFHGMAQAMVEWPFPSMPFSWLALTVLLAVAITLIWRARHWSWPPLAVTALFYFVAYLMMFVFLGITSNALFLPECRRLLAPLEPIFLMLFIPLVISEMSRSLQLTNIFGALGICMVLAHGVIAVKWAVNMSRDGQGYAARQWRSSPLITALRAQTERRKLFSNAYHPILYYTGRPCEDLPRFFDLDTMKPNSHFQSELVALRRAVEDGHGTVVFSSLINDRPDYPSSNDLRTLLAGFSFHEEKDGWIASR